MARSHNSRRGIIKKHSKRHSSCGPHKDSCPYCESNFEHATNKQRLKGTEELRRVREY